MLSEEGKLYDSKQGQALPEGVKPMSLLTAEELKAYPEPTTADVIPGYVARYWDMVALADKIPAKVIGPDAMLRDKPGFEVTLITRGSANDTMHAHDKPSVLMPVTGHWKVTWEGGSATLAPGDTMSIPKNLNHSVVPSMTGEAALYHIVGTGDPAGPTWQA